MEATDLDKGKQRTGARGSKLRAPFYAQARLAYPGFNPTMLAFEQVFAALPQNFPSRFNPTMLAFEGRLKSQHVLTS
jgi:hypothetical protein